VVFVVKSNTKTSFLCVYSHKSQFHILGYEKMLILYPRNQTILIPKVGGIFGFLGGLGATRGPKKQFSTHNHKANNKEQETLSKLFLLQPLFFILSTMSPSFIFDPPSDKENKFSEHESDEESQSQSQSQSEERESKLEDERIKLRVSKKKTVSPCDFTKYTESVAEEHARRSTT
jgi:hypothetical protein